MNRCNLEDSSEKQAMFETSQSCALLKVNVECLWSYDHSFCTEEYHGIPTWCNTKRFIWARCDVTAVVWQKAGEMCNDEIYNEKPTISWWNSYRPLLFMPQFSIKIWYSSAITDAITSNLSSITVKLSELYSALCWLRLICCGSHLERGWIQTIKVCLSTFN